jgi:hypothetical protein
VAWGTSPKTKALSRLTLPVHSATSQQSKSARRNLQKCGHTATATICSSLCLVPIKRSAISLLSTASELLMDCAVAIVELQGTNIAKKIDWQRCVICNGIRTLHIELVNYSLYPSVVRDAVPRSLLSWSDVQECARKCAGS